MANILPLRVWGLCLLNMINIENMLAQRLITTLKSSIVLKY